jgi:hypothetical protein
MTDTFLMGYPRTTPLLPLPPRRVRAVRQQPSVKGRVFAEFAAAIEGGEPHDRKGRLVGQVVPAPKTSRRPRVSPEAPGDAA